MYDDYLIVAKRKSANLNLSIGDTPSVDSKDLILIYPYYQFNSFETFEKFNFEDFDLYKADIFTISKFNYESKIYSFNNEKLINHTDGLTGAYYEAYSLFKKAKIINDFTVQLIEYVSIDDLKQLDQPDMLPFLLYKHTSEQKYFDIFLNNFKTLKNCTSYFILNINNIVSHDNHHKILEYLLNTLRFDNSTIFFNIMKKLYDFVYINRLSKTLQWNIVYKGLISSLIIEFIKLRYNLKIANKARDDLKLDQPNIDINFLKDEDFYKLTINILMELNIQYDVRYIDFFNDIIDNFVKEKNLNIITDLLVTYHDFLSVLINKDKMIQCIIENDREFKGIHILRILEFYKKKYKLEIKNLQCYLTLYDTYGFKWIK